MAISQVSEDVNFIYRDFNTLKKWISYVISAEGCQPGDITIVFCSDEFLIEINKNYLSHDYYTDVITFDYSDDIVIGGDIMISIERVKENSEIFQVGFYSELNRVIIHGILHLIGYSDGDEKTKVLMKQREDYYLAKY